MNEDLVVVDLGFYTHRRYPEDESLLTLARRFRPGRVFGFDPHPGVGDFNPTIHFEGCEFLVKRAAAATYDGEIAYDPRPDRPLAASTGAGPLTVPCFDLARYLTGLLVESRVIVKMDVEGAEYDLLPHLIAHGIDERLELLLVEFHAPPIGPGDAAVREATIRESLRCPVETW